MWMMIAAIPLKEYDGISKKIMAQASALCLSDNISYLACVADHDIVINKISRDRIIESSVKIGKLDGEENGVVSHLSICKELPEAISSNWPVGIDAIYVRHMFPTRELIKMLKTAKQKNIKIIYEIPTYPYYIEQINESKNKLKTAIRLSVESLYWPFIYRCIDKLAVIRCNSNSKTLPKMVDITNGLTENSKEIRFCQKKIDPNSFVIIGVGTIYKYHGYDKVIDALAKYKETHPKNKIVFYVVGESDEISRLKDYCMVNNFSFAVFCGKKFGKELDELYNKADIAIGTMALNLRNADIDTAIKNIEYFSKGLPVITSGKIFDLEPNSGLYRIVPTNQELMVETILEAMNDFYSHDRKEELCNILQMFQWNSILSVFNDVAK